MAWASSTPGSTSRMTLALRLMGFDVVRVIMQATVVMKKANGRFILELGVMVDGWVEWDGGWVG